MYTPNPIDTSHVQLSDEILSLSERLAKNTHEVVGWTNRRRLDLWEKQG